MADYKVRIKVWRGRLLDAVSSLLPGLSAGYNTEQETVMKYLTLFLALLIALALPRGASACPS
jgi:hypothetical protein